MVGPADYRTYVLRHWRRDDGVERIEIEHVQSGTRARLASLAEALAWIDAGGPAPSLSSPPAAGPAPRLPNGYR
ncbi:MAG: hypothetical protein IT340_01990 [Chloroflexi bacterium]|nr:hypothetical protein [Chloroflexota bacterium]